MPRPSRPRVFLLSPARLEGERARLLFKPVTYFLSLVRGFVRAHPRLGDVFWRDTLIDAAIFREWVTNVGRRDAYGRIAHIFCEMFLRALGLTNGQSYAMPITQAELADATGLSQRGRGRAAT
jgi:hypothetical protein